MNERRRRVEIWAAVVGGGCGLVALLLGYSMRGEPLYDDARALWLAPGSVLVVYGLAVACGLWAGPDPRNEHGVPWRLAAGMAYALVGAALAAIAVHHLTADDRWLALAAPGATTVAVSSFAVSVRGQVRDGAQPLIIPQRLAMFVVGLGLFAVAAVCLATALG